MNWTNLFKGEKKTHSNTSVQVAMASTPEEAPVSTSPENRGNKARRAVYISHETHKMLTSLVRALIESGNEYLTVGSFADIIIRDFMKARKENINAIYREDRGNLL